MPERLNTVADALQLGDANIEGVTADDLLLDAPFLRLLPVIMATEGQRHSYLKRTAAPETGFRAVNQGVPNTVSTRELVEILLGYLDATVELDQALLDLPSGRTLFNEEVTDHIQSAFATLEKRLFYGTSGNSGFQGLTGFDPVSSLAGGMTLDAGGTGTNLTSAYLVRVSPVDICAVSPTGMIDIEIRESFPSKLQDANGNEFNTMRTPIAGWMGLKPGSKFSVARIANIEVEDLDSPAKLSDRLLRHARALFPASRKPTHLVLGEEALSGLVDGRVATTQDGREPETPERTHGMDVVTSDGISNAEPQVA